MLAKTIPDLLVVLMVFVDHYFALCWFFVFFIGGLISMTPLTSNHEHQFHTVVFVLVRKSILFFSFGLLLLLLTIYSFYDIGSNNKAALMDWLKHIAAKSTIVIVFSYIVGVCLRLSFTRYFLPFYSNLLRSVRVNQDSELATDIRNEQKKLIPKDFLPSKFYKEGSMLLGLDGDNKPIYIPQSTWREVNMQVIGATRYGKGIVFGCLMEQAISKGDAIFYIDPKDDKFAPHIMYEAAKKAGRKFVYLSLNDDEMGCWSPFKGGTRADGFARIETAFGLKLTGEAGTDFFKSQEIKLLQKAFEKTRSLGGLLELLDGTDAHRIVAELVKWGAAESLNPKKGKLQFDVDKAVLDGAVVYVKGSLYNETIRVATKVFIIELVQAAKRLARQRTNHLSVFVDEVSFLVSQDLSRALATMLGFNVNFALAYQSPSDLLNTDDKTINGKAISQSINTNCQVKAMYGGSDFETAEWIAAASGTINKVVTKLEKTEIGDLGGETWEAGRSVGAVEENLVNTNVVLTLPPRICVLLQPRQLATLCYTSFVPVEDMKNLNDFLDKHTPIQVEKNQNDDYEDDQYDNDFNEPMAHHPAPSTPAPELDEVPHENVQQEQPTPVLNMVNFGSFDEQVTQKKDSPSLLNDEESLSLIMLHDEDD